MTTAAPPYAQLVVDSSAMVALLADNGPNGRWATKVTSGVSLSAPSLMPFEAGNILRRQMLAGIIGSSDATLAHNDLTATPLDLYPYDVLAGRVWALRGNLTVYDAAYVALAELLGVPLITLDTKLARATGPRCIILIP